MNGTFSDQLGGVEGVFNQWGPCERTVVACALARRVPWPGLKLLQRAVDAALSQHQDDERLERDANDETLLACLLTRTDDDDDEGSKSLQQLLGLLPLLRTDNERAKDVYVSAAPALVQRCVDAPRRGPVAAELCRQLLCYLLVHPALTPHDQSILTQWLRYLENHISRTTENMWLTRTESSILSGSNIWGSNSSFRRTVGKNVEFRVDNGYTTDFLQESFSKNGRDVDISLEGEKLNFDAAVSQPKSQRSNSLTPPSTNFMHMSSSAENLSDEPFVQKPRSFSLSSEHSLSQMRPISAMYGTTGSETRLDDLRSNNFVEYPGMSLVAQWLKGLRLHKYVWLFTNISYEQMMAIDEEYLEKLGVTKGARHKLLLSIKKLKERAAALDSMAAELGAAPTPPAPPALARTLERLRGILVSPMPPGSDLPAAIVRVLELASKQLTSAAGPLLPPPAAGVPRVPLYPHDEEHDVIDPLSHHCWLVEKALHHESFSAPALVAALKRLRHRLPPRQFFHHVSDIPQRRSHKSRWRAGPANGYHMSGPSHKRWVPPPPAAAPPAPRGKSHSYPPFPPAAPRPAPPLTPYSSDEYSSLDALCLQMTEQAIN